MPRASPHRVTGPIASGAALGAPTATVHYALKEVERRRRAVSAASLCRPNGLPRRSGTADPIARVGAGLRAGSAADGFASRPL
eukprot:1527939-Pyramimonas_sp.AAC.1